MFVSDGEQGVIHVNKLSDGVSMTSRSASVSSKSANKNMNRAVPARTHGTKERKDEAQTTV